MYTASQAQCTQAGVHQVLRSKECVDSSVRSTQVRIANPTASALIKQLLKGGGSRIVFTIGVSGVFFWSQKGQGRFVPISVEFTRGCHQTLLLLLSIAELRQAAAIRELKSSEFRSEGSATK